MKMEMQAVNSPVIKVDARALVTGKPVYRMIWRRRTA